MGRNAKEIKLSEEEKLKLNKLVRQRTASKQEIERAIIILMANDGCQNKEIAEKLNTRLNTVGKWRNRFAELGMKGLKDGYRSGKPKIYDDNFRQKVFEVIDKKPPKGFAVWDGSLIAGELNCSPHPVWEVLRKEGIQLKRKRSWCVSTDPEFAAKAADIVGLYLNPPENAMVISVDEKPSIQAIEQVCHVRHTEKQDT